MQAKSTTFSKFMKEWGFFILFMAALLLSRLFLWSPFLVSGHSMDPTLANGEYLLEIRYLPIDRFDIVVAKETDENGQEKRIVKRVIGMPGDTIKYENDQLYINGKKTDEPYLKEYIAKFKKDKLQSTYSYRKLFQQIASQADSFTQDALGRSTFTVEVPEGHYFLLGDDRLVSRDSRDVGTFKAKDITGEAKFRLWPMNRIGTF